MSDHTNQAQVPEDEKSKAEQQTESTADETQEQTSEKSEVDLLHEQIESLNDRLLRTLAEYDNFRRRSQREKEAVYPQAIIAAVTQFLPILDTFDRALTAPCSDFEFKKGVEMILTNFKDALSKLGIEEFGEAGELFNPEQHNAVMHIEDDTVETSTIVEVFQKGYRLGDRIVRHAMVKVAN